jgi:hypothetical protein
MALGLLRFAVGVRRFCRDVETVPRALETVRARLQKREQILVDAFFAEPVSLRPPYGFMVDQWRRGGFLEVRREPPRVTARGKIPPVQTLAGPDRSAP